MPSRKKLSGALLDSAYAEVFQRTIKKLDGRRVCLTTDAWTNSRGESIVTYVVASRGLSFFLEGQCTGTQAHSSQWIAADITRISQIHSNLEISGVVTDNASNNRGAWRILQDRNSKGFYYGIYIFFSYFNFFKVVLPTHCICSPKILLATKNPPLLS